MIRDIVACILAGGEGRRLLPLTAHRAKPAIRFGASYRLIDFPLSNCVNSCIRKILIFSQYKSLSLERYLGQGWRFPSAELNEYLASLPPQKEGGRCYLGTADAVYQNLSTLDRIAPAYVLILASDHVYHMDFRHLLQFHLDHRADATVATFPVKRERACQFGIVTADRDATITSFLEKPRGLTALPGETSSVLASMGIYLFTFDALRGVLREDSLRESTHDFGRDILPAMVSRYRVAAFPFSEGVDKEPAYWRDVGTIDAYWEAQMELLGPHPQFRLQHPHWPLHTAPIQGPPGSTLLAPWNLNSGRKWLGTHSLMAQGCTVEGGRVDHSILSPGVWLESDAEVQESILLDGVRIGRGAKVRRAILDQGATVPPGTCIGYESAVDRERFAISAAGITVVGHTATIQSLGREHSPRSHDLSLGVSAQIDGQDEHMSVPFTRAEMAKHVA